MLRGLVSRLITVTRRNITKEEEQKKMKVEEMS